MWRCIRCETKNDEQNRYCVICGAARTEAEEAPASLTGLRPMEAPAGKKKSWIWLAAALLALAMGAGAIWWATGRPAQEPPKQIASGQQQTEAPKQEEPVKEPASSAQQKAPEQESAPETPEKTPEKTPDPTTENLVIQPNRPVTEEKQEETPAVQEPEKPKEPPVTLSGTLSAPMSCGVFQPMDLDSDGVSEYIKLDVTQNSHGNSVCTLSGKETADGQVDTYSFECAGMEPYPAQEFYYVDLDGSDSYVDIAVSYFLTGVKGGYTSRFLRFQNGEFRELGEVEGLIRESQGYSLPEIQFYGDGRILTIQHCTIMQTWYLEASYRLQNGKLELIPQEYYSPVWFNSGTDMGRVLTTKCKLLFGHADDKNALFGLPAGTTLEVLGCDGDSFVWFWCPFMNEIIVGHFFDDKGDRSGSNCFYSLESAGTGAELALLPFDNLMMFG